MGEAELVPATQQLVIHSTLIFYGDVVTAALAAQVAKDITDHWNEPEATARLGQQLYTVVFNIEGSCIKDLSPEIIFNNESPRNNYFRIAAYAMNNISFVDGLPCNTGYFKLDNLLNNSTTAAHEYGHTLGLAHPAILDIRGKGQPGIMYPRGTICDPEFQYDPAAVPGTKGGTLNPFTRKVLQADVDLLQLHLLPFNKNGRAVIGGFSDVYHQDHAVDE